MSRSPIQNQLLQKLTPSDRDYIMSCTTWIELALKEQIMSAGDVISYVYFPEDGVISLLAKTPNQRAVEVGMFGFEGMSNMVIRLGDRTALTAVVQVAGTAWRIKAEDYAVLLREAPSLNELTLRYKEATAIQFAYTAFANGSFKIEARLARWLLMSQDRAQREVIPMVHEFSARMLAVRRSGVTTATHVLEGIGAIKAGRGAITIRDRAKLLEVAGESYGVPEAEYERLMAY
jgi:CRP-like cAMP-binding protein